VKVPSLKAGDVAAVAFVFAGVGVVVVVAAFVAFELV
jgi:hypothetical protein